MEVAPFFVDFHHFLSIFTIFYRFSRFTHFCRDLHFVAIYALFPQFFLAKIAFSATSHVFYMYAFIPIIENASVDDFHRLFKIILIHQKVLRFIRKLLLILAFLDAEEGQKCIVSFTHSAQSIILIQINL